MRISIVRPEEQAAVNGPAGALADAERYCAEMARREAKNFYWGFIALPRPKRMAIYALYDFAREVDDDADLARGGDPGGALRNQRERLRRCAEGGASDPVALVLGHAIDTYRIPLTEIEQIIDGVESDLRVDRYASWPDLHRYCQAVASSVGRTCVRIFGFSDPAALDFADDLGAAMQLTNILRDVREDLGLNRMYLPLDELAQHGLSEAALRKTVAANGSPAALDGWTQFVSFQADRARALYRSGLRVIKTIPSSSAACVLTMAGIYQRLLARIVADPSLVFTQRISLSTRTKTQIALRAWLRALSR
jgi:phytoene synthase